MSATKSAPALPAVPVPSAEPNAEAARAALERTPLPDAGEPLEAIDLPAPTTQKATEKSASATSEKRKRGRPPGATPQGYASLRSREQMQQGLRERDAKIAKLEAELAEVTGSDDDDLSPEDLREGIAELLDMTFDAIATKRGEHWKLPPARRDRIAKPLARWAEPYGKQYAKEMPLVIAAVGLGAHVTSALEQDKHQPAGR